MRVPVYSCLDAAAWVTLAWICAVVASQIPEDWKSYISPEILVTHNGRDSVTLLYNTKLLEGDIEGIDRDADVLNVTGVLANFLDTSFSRWPNGLIPFQISETFTGEQQVTIKNALQKMSGATNNCNRFVQRVDHPNYLKFIGSTGCSSYIGRITEGEQIIRLAPACLQQLGDVQHEVMHALGFYHEMSRADRDDYVRINYETLQHDAKYNFDIFLRNTRTFGLPYDYASIMHYPAFAFAKDPWKPCIIPTTKFPHCIGQRDNLSFLDSIKIQIAYGCINESQIKAMNWLQYSRNNTMCSKVALRPNEEAEMEKSYYSRTFRWTSIKDVQMDLSV
ncbi:hatching enzyme 1.2-like isoform X1 [Paramacrobiotus metropolitanus]|uniref:hatching enzyme 1.2-like isoform X1 n=1 Tax=Paramacrobiotus metropolitanus TaxID=2943436 RepID=UPI002446527C|nr:hatching enzyme 1.2-like isoform X1 [Paramacrobiotus metropolitanus]